MAEEFRVNTELEDSGELLRVRVQAGPTTLGTLVELSPLGIAPGLFLNVPARGGAYITPEQWEEIKRIGDRMMAKQPAD